MRIGCDVPLDQAQQAQAAGYDYIEIHTQSVLRGCEPSSVWDLQAPDPDQLPLPIEVANHMLPNDLPVIGPQRNMMDLQNYTQRIVKRAQRLGVRCLVFDSDHANRCPDGVSRDMAWDHLTEFTRMAGEIGAHHGVTFAVKPVASSSAAGVIQTIEQAGSLCDRVDHRCVGIAIDGSLLEESLATDQAVLELGDRLMHVYSPGLTDDLSQNSEQKIGLEYFFCLLRKAGYNQRVTVNIKQPDMATTDGWGDIRRVRDAWVRSGQYVH